VGVQDDEWKFRMTRGKIEITVREGA